MRLVLLGTTILWLLLSSLGYAADQKVLDEQQRIEEALDSALDGSKANYQQQLLLVEQTDVWLAMFDEPPEGLVFKNRLVEAIALYHLGKVEESQALFKQLCALIDAAKHPNTWFQCNSTHAGIKSIAGQPSQSLQDYKALLGEDLANVRPELITRAQVNYAIALGENGRTLEASDLFDRLLVSALTNHDDYIALLAGNNLIVNLVTQGDHLTARETFDGLSSVMERNPDLPVTAFLRLFDFELLRMAGDHEPAIVGLERFVAQEKDATPLILGSAHRMLADALLNTGDLDAALAHALVAEDTLMSHAIDLNTARQTVAQTLIHMKDYDGAMKYLAKIDVDMEKVPARQVQIHRMHLEALLGQAGLTEESAVLQAFLDSDRERDQVTTKTRAEYFDARLTAAQRGLEVEQAEAQAQAAIAQNRSDERTRSLTIVLILVAALAGCLLAYLNANRRAERRLLEEKQAQNEVLEDLVASKTRELTVTMGARAEMERALERKKRTEAIGLLAGNVAHDFNNLLQVMASANETMASASATEEDKRDVLKVSNDSLDHASRIIRQLMAYSRQQDLAAHPLRFSEYLKSTHALLRSALGERNTLVIEDHSDNAGVLVDSAQLTTSLLNLISNATDAMPDGGTVVMSARVQSLDIEQSQLWTDIDHGEFLVLEVQDNGIGMSDSQVARAAEPFFTTKSPQSGTGLGLSSVYGFVKQSGGDLKIHSAPGKGTRIQIVLPLTQLGVREVPTPTTEPTHFLPGKRVLLVEDNESVATMLESILKHLELEVLRVASGEEAKQTLQQRADFDYVLTDVRMPGAVDGLALARWVQAEQLSARVLLMSGFSELGPEDMDLPLIAKPFNVEQLRQFFTDNSTQLQRDSVPA